MKVRDVSTAGESYLLQIWNMQNIFEKSFAVINMDQPIERIHVASGKPNMAIAQTRKYLGIWDIRCLSSAQN